MHRFRLSQPFFILFLLGLLLALSLVQPATHAAPMLTAEPAARPDTLARVWEELEKAYNRGDVTAMQQWIAQLPATDQATALPLLDEIAPLTTLWAPPPLPQGDAMSLTAETAVAQQADNHRQQLTQQEKVSRQTTANGNRENETVAPDTVPGTAISLAQWTQRPAAAIHTVGSNCTFATLQAAINAAASGDTILVEAKTFSGTAATANISSKSLWIAGGYDASCSTLLSNSQTTLDATGAADSVLEIYGSGGPYSTILVNFVLTGGAADTGDGGGIELSDGHSVALSNVIIEGNGSANGAGVLLRGGATLTSFAGGYFAIRNNAATINGGGIYCIDSVVELSNSDIGGLTFSPGPVAAPNTAVAGGGLYLDNCSVTLSQTDGTPKIWYNQATDGAGLYATNNSLVAINDGGSTVSNNSASRYGGGLYLAAGADLILQNGRFLQNQATSDGGGFYATGSGTSVTTNRTATCPSDRCANIVSNSAGRYGGAFYAGNGAVVNLTATYVEANSASSLGSAAYLRDADTTVTLDGVMLVGNLSPGDYLLRLYTSSGAAPQVRLINTTVASNSGQAHLFGLVDQAKIDVDASIIWNNDGILQLGAGELAIDCSILPSYFAGVGNLAADPQFMNMAGGDYHLKRSSPAIDHCFAAAAGPDIDGEARSLDVVGLRQAQGLGQPWGLGPNRIAATLPQQGTTADVAHIVRLQAHDWGQRPLTSLLDSAVRVVDYGSWVWLELTDSQYRQLQTSGVRWQQENSPREIQINGLRFDPLGDSLPLANGSAMTTAGQGLALVQLWQPATDADLAELNRLGTVLQYIPNHAFLIWLDENGRAQAPSLPQVRWLGDYAPAYRVSASLSQIRASGTKPVTIQALLLDDGRLDQAARTILDWDGQLLTTAPRHVMGESARMQVWEMRLPPQRLTDLSQLPQLIYADVQGNLAVEDESSNQIIARNNPGGTPVTGYRNWLNSTGYDGTGVTVAIVDSGIDWDHPDLNVVSGTEYGGYVEPGEPGSDGGFYSGHGTHVAGIVAGTGASNIKDSNGFLYGQGVAPGAVLHAQDAIAALFPIYAQDFEANNGGLASAGTFSWEWGNSPGLAGTPPSPSKVWGTAVVGDYSNSEVATLTSPNIDLSSFSGSSSVNFSWWDWYSFADSNDCVTLYISQNGGSTWDTTGFQPCGWSNGWTQRVITLNDTYLVSNFRYQFVFNSDASGTDLGYYLDDVVIYAPITLYQRVYDSASNADLSNNSWYFPSSGTGYSLNAANQDDYVLDAIDDNGSVQDPFLAVFSAGNEGCVGEDCDPCPGGGPCLQSITQPKEAKNILVVGSTLSARSGVTQTHISPFSSRGPAADGRIRPDVVAPGSNIISTENITVTTGGNTNDKCSTNPDGSALHAWCSGTSMAAPHVAGAAALFVEFWRDLHGSSANPPPALVKAAIINSTDDLGGLDDGFGTPIDSRPSIHQGWGLINIDRMLNPTVTVAYYDDPHLLRNTADFWEQQIVVANPAEPLRITLVWMDPAAAPNANPALVNNLDLWVEDPNGDVWPGNAFGDNGWSIPDSDYHDTLNNVENSWIENPLPGVYTIRVIAIDLNGDGRYFNGDSSDQPFSLVCYNCAAGGPNDAGADEANAFVSRNGASCEYGSIGAAISAATAGDVLYVAPGTYYENLGTVTKNITIAAASDTCQTIASEVAVTLDGGDSSRILQVSGGATITLSHLFLQNGYSSLGGDVYVAANSKLVLDRTFLSDGTATNKGGALRVFQATAELINDSQIASSYAPNGGGTAVYDGTLLVQDDSRIYLNEAGGDGGGIYAEVNSQLTFSDTARLGATLAGIGNSATQNGGGAYLTTGSQLSLNDSSLVSENEATLDGGGLYLTGGSALFINDDTLISENYARDGGGIFAAAGSQITSRRGTFDHNYGTRNGGAVYLTGSGTGFDGWDLQVLDNVATGQGGGISVMTGAVLTLTSSAQTQPSSLCHPALIGPDNFCTSIGGNSAGSQGGGIYVDNATASLSYAGLWQNQAVSGAAIAADMAQLTVQNSRISSNNNSDYLSGALMTLSSSGVDLRHLTVADNSGRGIWFAPGTNGDLHNNLVWDNQTTGLGSTGGITAVCNNTAGAPLSGTNNSSVDPQFTSSVQYGEYHLAAGSPLIDACLTGLNQPDLDDHIRPTWRTYDIGAIESQACPADPAAPVLGGTVLNIDEAELSWIGDSRSKQYAIGESIKPYSSFWEYETTTATTLILEPNLDNVAQSAYYFIQAQAHCGSNHSYSQTIGFFQFALN